MSSLVQGPRQSRCTNPGTRKLDGKIPDAHTIKVNLAFKRHVKVAWTIDVGGENADVDAKSGKASAQSMDRLHRPAVALCGKVVRQNL